MDVQKCSESRREHFALHMQCDVEKNKLLLFATRLQAALKKDRNETLHLRASVLISNKLTKEEDTCQSRSKMN